MSCPLAVLMDTSVRPGTFEYKRFYELEVNGTKLVDWVRRLIEGEPVDDVHCKQCRAD
jgi:hypothetical protein